MAIDSPGRVEDIVREAVFSSPSIYGRLVAVSGLRHREDNKYYHELSWQHGVTAIDAILRDLHREAFVSWLVLSVRQQQGDLTIFLRLLGDDRPSPHGLSALCQALIPEQHLPAERELFLSDIRYVIAVVYGREVDGAPISRRTGAKSTPRAEAKVWTGLVATKWLVHTV